MDKEEYLGMDNINELFDEILNNLTGTKFQIELTTKKQPDDWYDVTANALFSVTVDGKTGESQLQVRANDSDVNNGIATAMLAVMNFVESDEFKQDIVEELHGETSE
jgi:hypothetical protein